MTTALRAQSADEVKDVERAVLEPGGALVVTLRPQARTADTGHVEGLHRRLDELERRLLAAIERPS